MNEPSSDLATLDSDLGFLSGDGEMATLMRAHDWSTSSLGDPSTWPQSLRSVVGLMVANKHLMFVAWGPDLAFLYNDGYRPVFGAKHPWALGRPFREVWPEIWDDVEPLVNTALGGEATWSENLPLVMNRHGYPEDAWFTFSYSPVRDESGHIAGMFCAGAETTAQVLGERRLVAERERLAQTVDQAPGFMAVLRGPELRFDFANAAYQRVTGRVDFVGKTVREAFPDLEGQGLFERLDEVYATGERFIANAVPVWMQGTDATEPQEYILNFIYQPILDDEGAVTAIFVEGYDVTDTYRAQKALREREQHLQVLVNELNHRVKNSLATVQAIALQTFRNAESIEHATTEFSARLVALAGAHDVLTEQNWVGADLHEIVERAIHPFLSEKGDRFRLDGPTVPLASKPVLAISMALHELCTNAAKYGALSNEAGCVEIAWSVYGGAADRRLHLRWEETGGPPVEPPKRKGFGSRLIESGLAAELDGEVRIAFEPGGVVCTVDAPLPPA